MDTNEENSGGFETGGEDEEIAKDLLDQGERTEWSRNPKADFKSKLRRRLQGDRRTTSSQDFSLQESATSESTDFGIGKASAQNRSGRRVTGAGSFFLNILRQLKSPRQSARGSLSEQKLYESGETETDQETQELTTATESANTLHVEYEEWTAADLRELSDDSWSSRSPELLELTRREKAVSEWTMKEVYAQLSKKRFLLDREGIYKVLLVEANNPGILWITTIALLVTAISFFSIWSSVILSVFFGAVG